MDSFLCVFCRGPVRHDLGFDAKNRPTDYFKCDNCLVTLGIRDADVPDRIRQADQSVKRRVLRWLRQQPAERHDTPVIDGDILQEIEATPAPLLAAQIDNVLIAAVKRTSALGAAVSFDDPNLLGAALVLGQGELRRMVGHLQKSGFLEVLTKDLFAVNAAGFDRVDKLQRDPGLGRQAFVAMWFDPSMAEIFKGPISKGIAEAGWEPFRVDKKEHNEKIDDEIIAEIKRSRFMVADFTSTPQAGQRGSVYYEAGFAKALGLRVVFTCRRDALALIQFDTRQYNFIDWDDHAEFAQRLTQRVRATIGQGPMTK